MAIVTVNVIIINLNVVVILQHLFGFAQMDSLNTQSLVSTNGKLTAQLQASDRQQPIYGGVNIDVELSLSYDGGVSPNYERELLNEFNKYCHYVDCNKKTVLYYGGDTTLNCTIQTQVVGSNYTCYSTSYAVHCFSAMNLTNNFLGNSSVLNNMTFPRNSTITRNNTYNITEITWLRCVNVTAPLVPYKPRILPMEYFNLTRYNATVNISLPSEFDIVDIEDLELNVFNNITGNCTEYVVNSTYVKHTSLSHITLNVQFANIGWNASMIIHVTVSERVVPKQSFNITANVSFDGDIMQVWIGPYNVPGLQFQSFQVAGTSFDGTPGNILYTDEEDVTLTAKFAVPSVTTDINVYVKLPIYGGVIPLKIISAAVTSMHPSIKSSKLNSRSSIGNNIVLSEVRSLNPPAQTLVTYKFGQTVTSPQNVEKTVTLQIIGRVDAADRHHVYVAGALGNITSWLTYRTEFDIETVEAPLWFETELGEPRLKYEMRFTREDKVIEAGVEMTSHYKIFNPPFSTDVAGVSLDVSFDPQYMTLIDFNVQVCNVSYIDPQFCMTAWPSLNVSNASASLNIEMTNLTAGYGIFGKAVSVILSTVPANQRLFNEARLRYRRKSWNDVEDVENIPVTTQSISVSSQLFTSSVDATLGLNAAVGETVTCRINGTIPVTTNKDFSIVIGSDKSVEYGTAKIVHVGSNLLGMTEGTEFNITSQFAPHAGHFPVFLGRFGVVINQGVTAESDDSKFIVEVLFTFRNIPENFNSKSVVLTSTVYHSPSNRHYTSDLIFNIVEPSFTASVVISPTKNVQQDSEVSFVASITRSSTSTSTAFNMIALFALPSPFFVLTNSGPLRSVQGSESPLQFLSSEERDYVVLIYENDAVSQDIEIRYTARTSSILPACTLIKSSYIMTYTSLPNNLNQSLARKYPSDMKPQSQPEILTFRPDPFLNFSFHSHNEGRFDAGDILQFTIVSRNIGVDNVQPTAYTVEISIEIASTIFSNTSFVCQGIASSRNGETFFIAVSNMTYAKEIRCELQTTLNTVKPSQTIRLLSSMTYHCLPPGRQNQYEKYSSSLYNEIFIKNLRMELSANGSSSHVFCGDVLKYRVRIALPEVTTSLRVEYELPTILSNARGKRSIRHKRASQLQILFPNSSQTSYKNGGNVVVSGMSESLVNNIYTVMFPAITNRPDNIDSVDDILDVEATFFVENQPVIFSGRSFNISSTVYYQGGHVSQTSSFSVVGPLVKPHLQMTKSFQVLDANLDSPIGKFYVNISHTNHSRYDAYEVNITDYVEGMTVLRDEEFPTVQITSPENNVNQLTAVIPVLEVGKTISFYYKTKFKVDVKTPKYVQKVASLTWRSPQLNSPVYGPLLNADACVARNDTIKEQDEPLYSFLALGAFLGLMAGFLSILIAVCIYIKCCRRGRLVPYYRVLTGTTTYTTLHNEETDDQTLIVPATSTSINQSESVVYVISFDDAKKIESNLESLDIEATKNLDHKLESSRHAMFVSVFERVLLKLRKKRDISEDQEKTCIKKLHGHLEEINARNRQELNNRLQDLQNRMRFKGEAEMKKLDARKQQEIQEATAKLDGADKKKTKEILSLIVAHYQSLENDVRSQIQLEHDVEQEKIKKEISVNGRVSLKETQSTLLKEMIIKGKINEEEARMILSEHLDAIATIEKLHDDEKSRRVMALEMRLQERKTLALELRKQKQQEKEVLAAMKEQYDKALENLVTSSQVSEDEAESYKEKLLKDVETLNKKMRKQRHRQERTLHDRLTLLKKKKLQEKEEEYKLAIKDVQDMQNDGESPKDLIYRQQELTQKYNEEIHELERELDEKAADDLKELRVQYAKEARGEYRNRIEKYYMELMKKGAMDNDYTKLLESHDEDVVKLLEHQQAQQNKQKISLMEKLQKRRELLMEKMKAEQKEQEQIRNEEHKVLKNMIENQVVISQEEKKRLLREHEQNMAELESSLVLKKLRQKQILEEKLEKRRALKMAKLQQKHENEQKRIKIENVDGATEEADLLKKQELEKQQLIENNSDMENEIEKIREEMLKARMEALQEHNDRLGALIADAQIKKANQIAEINKQQRALGQLQTSILDDLDEKGVLVDPETKEILKQHQEQSQKLEEILKNQRDEQEKTFKERLQEKLRQKEQRLMQDQKDEIAKCLDSFEGNNALKKFRKTVVKAGHEARLAQERQKIVKEIEQSVNEMKLQLELNRLKAVEKQNIQFISALVKCGKIQKKELDSVLQVLFPSKKPEEIDQLLTQIYGESNTRSSALALNSSKPSSLEMKVIAQISPLPSNKRKVKPRFEKTNLDDLPPPEVASSLPPVIVQGSKGSIFRIR